MKEQYDRQLKSFDFTKKEKKKKTYAVGIC